MIRALFNLGEDSTGSRVARKRQAAPKSLSRRGFLTFGRAPCLADGTWRVTIDADLCTDCNACTRICGAAALRRRDDDLHAIYSLSVASCTGCRDCEVVCASKAVNVQRGAERGEGVIEIVRLDKVRCARCGQSQAGVVDGLCPACQPVDMFRALRR